MKTTTYITVEVEHESIDADSDFVRDSVQYAVDLYEVGSRIADALNNTEPGERFTGVKAFVADRTSNDAIEPLVAAAEELDNAVSELGWSHRGTQLNGSAADHAALLYEFLSNAGIDGFWVKA